MALNLYRICAVKRVYVKYYGIVSSCLICKRALMEILK